ncbi:c-type cytochrome [Azohydromonas caseinilytica]|uniref:Cytochrome c family protein n=1 Tax=Azohydromonas caseinilytica TaxID=2728836 RepID=A0A848FDR1_9BURK|nr:cytochrome c family protein [Azohydromonas caseinilytica]NML16519.1 cytochrome c family protein [Azohydromonas caseinilytica]
MLRQLLPALALLGGASTALAGNAVAGKTVFARCASCHQVGPAARSTFGPHLNGIVGRRAGSLPGYGYSAALKASGLVWDEATLRAFIKAPGDTVPGTKMRLWWLGSERQLDDLLAYLRTFP